MPRKADRARRRAMNVCVECPEPSFTARCPRCKAREREREKRARCARDAEARQDESGRRDWNRTNDLYHVKVAL